MISKELLVVAYYDGSISLYEVDFRFIPIRIRVARIPLGLVNKTATEAIGDEVGKFMEVDFEDDGMAASRFLCVKVRLDICKPLISSITIDLGENERTRWCPVSYEFLPNFLYICRLIGYTDKVCMKKLGDNEKPPL